MTLNSQDLINADDGNDSISIGYGYCTVYGGAGNDSFVSGVNSDTLVGGTGDDIYYVNNTNDVVTENAGEGIDTVNSDVTYTLSSNVENLTLTGTNAINGTGNELNNYIVGNSANNIITSGTMVTTGNDTIYGGAGDDSISVGAGNSYLNGGEGNDTINTTYGFDTYEGGAGNDVIIANMSGSNTYIFNLGDGQDSITDTPCNADTYTDVLKFGTGISKNNILFTKSGNDMIVQIKDTTDQITIKDWYLSTGNQIEQFKFTDGTTITKGQIIAGTTGDDSIVGSTGNDFLYGNAGNDIIDGGAGADAMFGGAGNDTYYVDNTGDSITENTNEGVDTVISSIGYNLPNNIENLTLTGTTAYNCYGNSLNNLLIGNSANDNMYGGAGVDTMYGGTGSDYYFVDNAGDVVVEYANEGTTLIRRSLIGEFKC